MLHQVRRQEIDELVINLINGINGLGLSCEEIARRVDCSARVVYRWKAGEVHPSLWHWVRLEELADRLVGPH